MTFEEAAKPYTDDAESVAAAMRDALKAELRRDEYAGLTRQRAYDLLHQPQEVKTTSVQPVPLSLEGIMGVLGPSLAAVMALPS